MGIRPEHLQLANSATCEAGPGPVFDARVELIEWLGADILAHLQIPCPPDWTAGSFPDEVTSRIDRDGSIRVSARVDPKAPLSRGDRIRLRLD